MDWACTRATCSQQISPVCRKAFFEALLNLEIITKDFSSHFAPCVEWIMLNKNVIIYINLVVDIFGVFPYFLWLHPSDYLWKSAFACRGALQKTQPKANRILKKKAWRKKDWENHGQNKEDSKMVKPPQVGLSEAVCWPLLIYKEKTYSASITFYFSLKLYWWF